MSARLEFSRYEFEEREEFCLTAGAGHEHRLILVPPLFDEMNRVRKMLVDVMRLLAERGIGSLLPDLPGTNESLFPAEKADLSHWRGAIWACASQHDCQHIASVRGGCLIDDAEEINRRWRLAPTKGSTLLRTMMRTRIASDKEAGVTTTMAELTEKAQSEPIILAGNAIGPELFAGLQDAVPQALGDVRTAGLETDSKPADVKLPGSALWLRAEPDADAVLSAAIADDLAEWIAG